MRLNVNGSIFFVQKMKKIDFEENILNERFGELSFLTSKDLSLMCIKKITKMERTLILIHMGYF